MFSNGGHLGSAILNLLIFPKPSKSAKIDQEVTKINDTKMRNLIPYYHMVILKI